MTETQQTKLSPLHERDSRKKERERDWEKREMESGKSSEAEARADAFEKMASAVADYPENDYSDDDDDENGDKGDGEAVPGFVPGPLVSLKEQIEKDKDDDSLRRWKEKLLGCVEGDLNGQMEPEVKFLALGIISDDFGEINAPLPVNKNENGGVLFVLKEGSQYRLKLTFSVLHNIVCGLIYTNTVWRAGIQVDQSRGMLGTFAPQQEPYTQILDQETTPSGILARGIYSAELKFEDDDKRCHLELKYSFEIRRR